MSGYDTEVVSVDTEEPVEAPAAPEVAETPTEPVEEPQVETPEPTNEAETEPTEPVETEPVDNGLVKMPDGRELTPEQVKDEYIKLNSDYTRKSQRLATHEKGNINNQSTVEEDNDEWIPETYDDLYDNFKQRQQAEKQQEVEQYQNLEKGVKDQLAELKKTDSTLNDSELFRHALKYNFKDLGVAHSNMKDMQKSINKAKEDTVKNVQKRNADPVSGVSQSGNSVDGDVYDPSIRNQSAVDYLNSLN